MSNSAFLEKILEGSRDNRMISALLKMQRIWGCPGLARSSSTIFAAPSMRLSPSS